MSHKGIECRLMAQKKDTKKDFSIPDKKRLSIVTVGGGTGHYTILSGLKEMPVDITAIVSTMDNGGPNGALRDEYGVLPPGDLRKCLIALSEADEMMRALIGFRYASGNLKGQTFGNIFISTLEQVTGDITTALAHVQDLLKIRGRVLPVSLKNADLVMTLGNGAVLLGEHMIDEYQLVSKFGVKHLTIRPRVALNPDAKEAILQADAIIVGPGDIYTSLLPNFLVRGFSEALKKSRAKKIFVANLINKYGQTDGLSVGQFLDIFAKYTKGNIFNTVLYNTEQLPASLIQLYKREGEPVLFKKTFCPQSVTFVGKDILSHVPTKKQKGDVIKRTLIRHDPDKLARAIMELLETS